MSSVRRIEYAVFLAAVVARLVFHLVTNFTADDAFITFRYAGNITSGLGFVYNEGERVLGTTTPLFTFILAVFSLIRVSVNHAALFVSLVSSGVTAVLLYRLARALRFGALELLPAIAYILWPRSLPDETGGMETAFFTMLILAAFYYQHRKREVYAIGMATLATAVRPEGLWLLALLLGINLYRQREAWWQYLVTPFTLLIPWIAFATAYFGSPIPNSVPAKMALYSHISHPGMMETLRYLLGLHVPLGWVLLPAVVVGGWWLNRKQNYGVMEAVWMVGMVTFYALMRSQVFSWYVVPIYPVFLLFVCASAVWLFGKLRLQAARLRFVARMFMVAMVIILLFLDIKPLTYCRSYQRMLTATHQAAGLYVNTHTEPGDLVAAEDIGYIGYLARRRILDRVGLISPEAVPYNLTGRFGDLVRDYKPRLLLATISGGISGFVTDSVFLAGYRRVQQFGEGNATILVFQRIDSTNVSRNAAGETGR